MMQINIINYSRTNLQKDLLATKGRLKKNMTNASKKLRIKTLNVSILRRKKCSKPFFCIAVM